MTLCFMKLRNFAFFLGPNVIADGLTKKLSICSLTVLYIIMVFYVFNDIFPFDYYINNILMYLVLRLF